MELVVVPMLANDLVFRLLWFLPRNPNLHWHHHRLLAQQHPGGAAVVAVDRVDHQKCPRNVPVSAAMEETSSEGGGSIPDIQIHVGTAFVNHLASEQVIRTVFLTVDDWTAQLGATVEGSTDGEWGRPQERDMWTGSSSGSSGRTVYQQLGPWITASSTPRHEGSTVQRWLALPQVNHS